MIAITALPAALLRLLILVHLHQGLPAFAERALPASPAARSGASSDQQSRSPGDEQLLDAYHDGASSAILQRAIDEEVDEWLRTLALAGLCVSAVSGVTEISLTWRVRSDCVACKVMRNAPLLI